MVKIQLCRSLYFHVLLNVHFGEKMNRFPSVLIARCWSGLDDFPKEFYWIIDALFKKNHSQTVHGRNQNPNSFPASLPSTIKTQLLSFSLYCSCLWVDPIFTLIRTLLGMPPRSIFFLPVWLAIDLNFHNPIWELSHQSLKAAWSALFPSLYHCIFPLGCAFSASNGKKSTELLRTCHLQEFVSLRCT